MYCGGARVSTRVCVLGVPGYVPEYVLSGYPGTYPSMYSRGTRVPTRVCTMGAHGYLPTRVCTLGVPGYLPKYYQNFGLVPGYLSVSTILFLFSFLRWHFGLSQLPLEQGLLLLLAVEPFLLFALFSKRAFFLISFLSSCFVVCFLSGFLSINRFFRFFRVTFSVLTIFLSCFNLFLFDYFYLLISRNSFSSVLFPIFFRNIFVCVCVCLRAC